MLAGLPVHSAGTVGVPRDRARQQDGHALQRVRAHGVLLRHAGAQGAQQVPLPVHRCRQETVPAVSLHAVCCVLCALYCAIIVFTALCFVILVQYIQVLLSLRLFV